MKLLSHVQTRCLFSLDPLILQSKRIFSYWSSFKSFGYAYTARIFPINFPPPPICFFPLVSIVTFFSWCACMVTSNLRGSVQEGGWGVPIKESLKKTVRKLENNSLRVKIPIFLPPLIILCIHKPDKINYCEKGTMICTRMSAEVQKLKILIEN